MDTGALIAGFFILLIGGLQAIRPDVMISLQQYLQRVVMGATYTPSARTTHIFRLTGALLVVVGLALIVQSVPPSPADDSTGLSGTQFTDPESGATFFYPEAIDTHYITTVDWPPHVRILDEPFSCTEAGLEEGRAGKTEKRIIDGALYCRTTVGEGAAGSTYNQYAYLFERAGKTIALTFTVRLVQCANYDEPEQSTCAAEQRAFDVDRLVAPIVEHLTVASS